MTIDQDRVNFMRGVLAMAASNRQLVQYEELRRLGRMSKEMVGEYLGEVRKGLHEDEPDICAIVVSSQGVPGPGWGPLEDWQQVVTDVHNFWSTRKTMDNNPFEEMWGILPTYPAKKAL